MSKRRTSPPECVAFHGSLLIKAYKNLIIGNKPNGNSIYDEVALMRRQEIILDSIEEFINLAIDMANCECCDKESDDETNS